MAGDGRRHCRKTSTKKEGEGKGYRDEREVGAESLVQLSASEEKRSGRNGSPEHSAAELLRRCPLRRPSA